jgi:hypothetical protein
LGELLFVSAIVQAANQTSDGEMEPKKYAFGLVGKRI